MKGKRKRNLFVEDLYIVMIMIIINRFLVGR